MVRVRVANELGAGNGKGAKFATMVAVVTSVIIGLFFWVLIMIFDSKIALIFTSSKAVLKEVKKLSVLLAFTILLNSVQPILSGMIYKLFFCFIFEVHFIVILFLFLKNKLVHYFSFCCILEKKKCRELKTKSLERGKEMCESDKGKMERDIC